MTTRLHHEIRGDGPPLLLVHGLSVDHRLMLPFEDWLDASGWRRLYVDLPGHGRSAADNVASTADVAACLAGFVDDVIGDAPFALVGNSFGGMLARELVAQRPEQVLGLGLLCPAVTPPGRRTLPPRTVLRRDSGLVAGLAPEDAAEYTDMTVIEAPATWAAFERYVLPGLRAHDPDAVARIQQDYELTVDPAGAFDRPSWLVTGRQDHVVGFADQVALLAGYPRMTATVLDGAGHNAHLEAPGTRRGGRHRLAAAASSTQPVGLTQTGLVGESG